MNKKTTRLIIVAVLMTVLAASLYLVKRVQETRRGAAGTGDVRLSFQPAVSTLAPGQQTTVSVVMNSSAAKQIRAAEVIFSYDNSVFSIDQDSIACGSVLPSTSVKKVTSSRVQISCYLPVSSGPFTFSPGQDVVLATFSITVREGVSSQSSTLSFTEGIVPEIVTNEDLSDSGTDTVFTIDSGSPAEVSFSIDSDSEVSKGSRYTADVVITNLSDQTKTLQSAEARISFDNSVFEIDEEAVECGSSLSYDGAIVVQEESLTLSCLNLNDPVSLTSGSSLVLGSFDFTIRPETTVSSSTLTFSKGKVPIPNSTNSLVSQLLSKTYTISGGVGPNPTNTPTLTPTPTTTPIPSGDNPVMNFKVRFNPVKWQIPDQQVLVKVVNSNFKKEFTGVTVTSDEEGVLSGSLALVDVPVGGGYQIIIKGPKHLAEKFCADGQQDRCQWGQSITIADTNDFDFTGMPLEPGDIPDANGVQDGVVDGGDFDALKSALNSSDKALRSRVNLDFDTNDDGEAIISGRDISAFLETMGRRYDDDN